MKKFLSAIALVMVLVLALGMFASCKPADNGDNTPDNTPAADKVTVCWYQGSKLLKEEEIDKGSKLTSWEPTAEGKTFDGWYAEASCTQPFDFEAAINEDVDIFAKFKSDEHVEDDREFYLIGTGAGDMKDSAWNHNAPDNLKLVKQDVEGANVYVVTITMYAGDRFQICYGSWDGQQGIGIFVGAEYADGINPNKPAEGQVTAADQKYAEVKNANGEVVFIGGDENNNSFKNWNAILNEGHDGVYKFTLTTYPNAGDYNNVTFELIEKLEPMTETHKMHLVGTFNGWNASDEAAEYHMNKSEDGSTWSAFLTVTDEMLAEGNVEFKVVNQVPSTWHGTSDGGNIVITEAGVYAVRFTVEGEVVDVEKCAYYVVGTLLDSEGNTVNYSVKAGVSPALTVTDGVATVEFEAYDATVHNDYSWMIQQEKKDPDGVAAIISIKIVLGSELGIKDWYSAEGGDNWYLSAGTYTITLDIATGAATVVKA